MRRLLFYVFGGFGSLLIVAGILCCVAWKPLGEPLPTISNLALGVVLFIVAALQAVFNAWQVFSSLIHLILGLEY
jgi:sodium/potassium-transporting ATPase subunit alpha